MKPKKKQINYQQIEEAKRRIKRCGGDVGEQTIRIPSQPGLKVWAAVDCLMNHAGYWQVMQ